MSEHHIAEIAESPNPRVRPGPTPPMSELAVADLQRRRQQVLNLLLGIVVVGGFFVFLPFMMEIVQDPGRILAEWPYFVIYAVVVMAFLMRTLHYHLRLAVLVTVVYLFGALNVQAAGVAGPGVWYLLVGPALLFSLGGWRAGFFALAFSALVYVGLGVAHYQGWMSFQLPDPTELGSLLSFSAMYFLTLAFIGVAQGMFNRAQEATLQTAWQRAEALETSRQQSQRQADELASVNRQLQRQLRQFIIAAEVLAATRGITTLETFLDHVVDLIHQRLADMGVTSVGLYMYETALTAEPQTGMGQRLRLRAVSEDGDTSEVSEHRIPSLVNTVLYSQVGRISRESQKGIKQLALPLRLHLHLHPHVPLHDQPAASEAEQAARASQNVRQGLRAAGVLFLQSAAPEAFHAEDLDVWQVLADQLSIAIQNISLLQQTQHQVRELQRRYQRYDQEIWQREVGRRKVFRYAQGEVIEDEDGDGEVESAELSRATRAAVRERRLVIDREAQDGVARITVPITMRDAVIGVMHIEKSGARARWSESQVDLVRMINEQLELALDSARLFESTQMRAARERLVGDISSQMRAAVNLEDMLRTAVQELGQRLSLDEVVLEMMAEPSGQSHGE
ncbi:MAG: hypothetical protein ACLFTI_00395 [Anaerolineales bacterium]